MLDDPTVPLLDVGLQTGDHVTALATHLPSITGTRADFESGAAFASWFRGDDGATTWGDLQFLGPGRPLLFFGVGVRFTIPIKPQKVPFLFLGYSWV